MPSEEDLQKMREGRYAMRELEPEPQLKTRAYDIEAQKLMRERNELAALRESLGQQEFSRLQRQLQTEVAQRVTGRIHDVTIGGVPTYEHVTPHGDEPTDHQEGGCSCNPVIDEATHTVFHRPLST